MKTFLIVPDLFHGEGGIARIMRLYIKALAETAAPGDTLRYAALTDSGDTSNRLRMLVGENSIAIDNCERSKLGFLIMCLLHGAGADRIICGHVHHLILARLAAVVRPSLKYYLIAHGIEVWRPFSLLERIALRRAHRIFCVSEYTRRQMLRFDSSLDPRRLVVIPNTFDPQFTRETAAKQNSSRSPGPRILVVSRLDSGDPYKGVDLMIEAMPLILRRFPAAQLRIVGGGNDRTRLQEFTRGLRLAESVHFTNIIDDGALRKEYADCDIFALPSRKEGFGLVYLEAMTYGKPCLAARAGGAPEVVNADVGALVEYGNVEQIAIAVADLVNHPRATEAILQRAEDFAYPAFRQRMLNALSPRK